VPASATPQTPWQLTRLSRGRYYLAKAPRRQRLDMPADFDYDVVNDLSDHSLGSDAHVLRVEELVAVTPLSLDMTSRLPLDELDNRLHQALGGA
jgi:5'-nucleotidase